MLRPLTVFLLALLILPSSWSVSAYGSSSLVISEIMFNPTGDENAREYVEIQNISGEAVSMEGCRIGDGSGFNDLDAVRENTWTIPAGGFAVIFDPDYFTANEPYLSLDKNAVPLTVTSKALGSRGLSNSTAEPVYLISAKGDTLSLVHYSLDCPEGHSWERVNPSGGDSPENFRPSREADGTPGYRNSVTPSDKNPALTSGSLRFNPNPPRMGEGLDIQVSCRNGGMAPLDDVWVSVRMLPDTSLGTLVFHGPLSPGEDAPEQTLHVSAVPGGLLTFQAVIEGGDPLSASDDTLRADLDVPVSAGAVSLNEVMAAPKDGPEWVELMNTGRVPVCLRGWRITDSRGVLSDSLDVSPLLPSGGFALVSGDSAAIGLYPGATVFIARKFPSLNNDGDRVVLLERSGALMDSMSFASAPSGVSLERISPGLSGKSAWDTCVDPSGATPGARNSLFFNHVEDDPASSGSTLTITPNPFSGSTIISYDLPFPLARVRLEVYDRRGRKAATIRDAAESGSVWSGTWESGKLPAGPYILSFEALNKNTGKMVTMRKTMVVGKKL